MQAALANVARHADNAALAMYITGKSDIETVTVEVSQEILKHLLAANPTELHRIATWYPYAPKGKFKAAFMSPLCGVPLASIIHSGLSFPGIALNIKHDPDRFGDFTRVAPDAWQLIGTNRNFTVELTNRSGYYNHIITTRFTSGDIFVDYEFYSDDVDNSVYKFTTSKVTVCGTIMHTQECSHDIYGNLCHQRTTHGNKYYDYDYAKNGECTRAHVNGVINNVSIGGVHTHTFDVLSEKLIRIGAAVYKWNDRENTWDVK